MTRQQLAKLLQLLRAARRDAGAREVLRDVLLESPLGEELDEAIHYAHTWADGDRVSYGVYVIPSPLIFRLGRPERSDQYRYRGHQLETFFIYPVKSFQRELSKSVSASRLHRPQRRGVLLYTAEPS